MYAPYQFAYDGSVNRLQAIVSGVVVFGLVIVGAAAAGLAWRVFSIAAGV